MVFFLLILLVITFNGLRFAPVGGFNEDYLDKKHTVAVNGIFVILVIFSHYAEYAPLGGDIDWPYLFFRMHMNQMVVATFWFYSGYGMMEAIRRTGGGYVNKLPAKFWQLLLRFDVAVLAFWILNAALGTVYPLRTVLLALPAWDSVGNSNWYIFDVLVEYLLMYAAFKAGKSISEEKGRTIGLFLLFIFTVIFIYAQIRAGRDMYAYDTVIILPLGAFYSEFRKHIEKFVMKSDLVYLMTLMVLVGMYCVTIFKRFTWGIEVFTVWAFAFISIVILITMKVSIGNPVLEWFGSHVFSIYILQRIPMTVLAHFGFIESHKYMSLVVVFAITMPLALIFEKITDRMIGAVVHASKTVKER